MAYWFPYATRFITCRFERKIAVYLPHSYAISGWVILTEPDNVREVEGMNSVEAMKFAVSGGVSGFHSDENIFKAPE